MQMLLNRVQATPGVQVGEIMSPLVARIAPDATARQGAAMLAYYGLTSIPVVERRGGKVVGVLSASDILHLRARAEPAVPGCPSASRLSDAVLDRYLVREIMLPVLLSLEPTASLRELADLIERTGTDRVLVIEAGRLCGTVSTTDLLRALSTPP